MAGANRRFRSSSLFLNAFSLLPPLAESVSFLWRTDKEGFEYDPQRKSE